MARIERLDRGSFYGAVQNKREFGGVIFTDLRHTTGRKLPTHAHELPYFGFLLEGQYAERYGRQHNQFGPFTALFRPGGIPHQDEIGPQGVKFFQIEIGSSWKQRLADCSGTLETASEDRTGGELLWIGMKLFRETRGGMAGPDVNIESLIAELLGTVAGMPSETAKNAPMWLERVIEKINEEFCERLTLQELSGEAGVHPVHLSRVFRKCRSEGVGEYVHRLRIRAACQSMLRPERTLAQISCETGFADQSHFTRTFRHITGMSPANFRKITSRAA